MRKTLSLALVLAMVLTLFAGFGAFAEGTTDVGTPRAETLIMETQTPTDMLVSSTPTPWAFRWASVSIS